MKAGSFSRSVVVKEWPSRHCFISLPRPWVSLTLPAPTPTFNLEVSGERSLLLSWAGDLHNPNPGEENTVFISREVLQGSGISDEEFGFITQVPVPPPCSSVTVLVGSLSEWQDLALNAEVAQSAFLSQVRVLGIGQSLPLWLEGGVHISLTVTHIDPPSNYAVLQPMTQVEVLPPLEHGESEEFCPINFTPPDLGSQRNSATREESPAVEQENTECNEVKTRNVKELKKYDQNAFEPLIKYITSKLQQQRIVVDTPHRKDIRHGYRVLPQPQGEISWLHSFIKSHPSLVIISKDSLRNVDYQKQISFVANVKKIESPRDKSEKSSSSREEDKGSDKQLDSKTPNTEVKIINHALCTVIVWENFIEKKAENNSFINNMTLIMNSHSCVVSDGLRRLMKLETFSIIELNSSDLGVKTLPVSIDISLLGPADESRCKLVFDNIKRLLNDATSEGDVIINRNTLLTCSIEEKDIDIFVTVRDGVPLKLTKKSVVLLEITHVSKPSSVPYISADMTDLNADIKVQFPYVGNQTALFQLQQHILLGSGLLLEHLKAVPQYALLYGSRGSGKTSLVETLAQHLSGFPHYLHFQIASFKQMKGKKMETVEKKLQLMFREAIFHKPSVIVLEDVDTLVPSKGIDDQESGQFHDHTLQMVNMLKGLLDSLLEFCHGDTNIFPTDNSNSGSVMVIATSISRTSVHPLLVNPQGCHYFPCSFAIPFLEPEERVLALNTMITAHVDSYTSSFGINAQRSSKSSVSKQADHSVAYCKGSGIETNLAVKLTENFVLPDLNHLAFRTFLQARQRLETNSSQSEYCTSCGNNISDIDMSKRDSPVLLNDTDCKEENESSSSFVHNSDLEAAREGYIPLALRGLELSEKKASPTMRVGGLADARKTLRETLTWPSTYPNLFSRVKLRLRSGILLYGPPGCGKTLIANSVVANCQLNFISVKGPELLSKYIGASEQAVRDAFGRASSAKPCVLFFDEFESIAPRRGHDSTGVTDRVVNQLLTQMDGVEGLSGVYILAATSRPDLIDPALLRPGRLDKCIFCPVPTLEDREDILRILSEDVDLGEEVDWAEIASATENFSGADLQSLLSTAQIFVAQEALGEALYEGVIESARTEKLDYTQGFASQKSSVYGSDISAEERNSMVQVVIEKENIEVDKHKNSTQEVIKKEEESDISSLNICAYAQESETQSLLECCAKRPGENQTLRVCQRHIMAALKEVKPSVTLAERRKYELLYESFTKSREGNFGKQTPGKRATLA